MVKKEAGLEQYTRSICGAGEPEAAFQTEEWLSGAYGRQEEVYRMCVDRCVLCNSEEAEDVGQFLVRCEEFAHERQRFVKEEIRISECLTVF